MLEQIAVVAALALMILGFFNRKRKSGKWLLIAGAGILVVAFAVAGWGEIKSGFVDALRD